MLCVMVDDWMLRSGVAWDVVPGRNMHTMQNRGRLGLASHMRHKPATCQLPLARSAPGRTLKVLPVSAGKAPHRAPCQSRQDAVLDCRQESSLLDATNMIRRRLMIRPRGPNRMARGVQRHQTQQDSTDDVTSAGRNANTRTMFTVQQCDR